MKIYWLTERERYLCFVLASFQAMKDRFVTIRSVENNNGRRPLVGQLSFASRHPGGPPLPPSAPPTTTTTLSYSIHPREAFAHDLNITLFNFLSFQFGIKLDKESFAQGVYHSSSVFDKKTSLNISYQVLFYMTDTYLQIKSQSFQHHIKF